VQLNDFWSTIGVPHLDLLNTYSGNRPGDLVVNRMDAHPNEASHEMAADAILPFLHRVLAESREATMH
jgi:hypothetical protein